MIADSQGTLRACQERRRILLASLLAICLGQAGPIHAEDTGDQPPPQAVAPAAPTSIPASDIPRRAEAVQGILRDASATATPSPQIEAIRNQIDGLSTSINKILLSREMNSLSELSPRGLYALRLQWQSVKTRLTAWQQTLSTRSQALAAQNKVMRDQSTAWSLTLDSRQKEELPAVLVEQVRGILKNIDHQEKALRSRLDELLTLSSRVSELNVRVDQALSAIAEADSANRGRLLLRDSEPLWRAVFAAGAPGKEAAPATGKAAQPGQAQEVIGGELTSALEQHAAAISSYLAVNGDRAVVQVLVFLGLAGLLALVDRRRAKWPSSPVSAKEVVDIVSHPIASAAMVSLVLNRSFYPGAPLAFHDMMRLVAVIPVAVLLSKAFSRQQRTVLYTLLSLFVLDVVRGLLQTQPLSSRLSLLVLTALGCTAMAWAIVSKKAITGRGHGAWGRVADGISRLAVLTFAGAIVANIVGIVGLAELLGEGTMLTIFAGFGLYAFSLVLMGLLQLLLQSPLGRKVRAFRRNPEMVHQRVEKTVNVLFVVFWLVLVSIFFNLWDPLRDLVVSVFSASLSIGQFQISLGDIVAFIVALWLGTQLSRFIRFILQEDVFTRVRLPRGVPATISMMVNYGIITIAFLIALAVAGFDLSRFAIIAGALSVGIGFGLQNVVNNFVSGLILAFERPIQVGDSVEVGALMGRVNRIGIRSSVVRTFDGSEVIVPNADFISKEVINWTLSDVTRRLIVPVGVAYGTNPHQVMDLLVKVAGSHSEVLQEPEPYALFTEFGDSSLNFELRAWCDFNEGLRVRTELNLAIHDALKEAGIEIPFPQRDLHLRSVDPQAGRNLAPRPGRKELPEAASQEEPIPQADTSSIPRSEE